MHVKAWMLAQSSLEKKLPISTITTSRLVLQAKGLELYAPCDISDLSEYGIGLSKNGANSNGQEFNFPAGTTVVAGTFIYVAKDAATFLTFMGFLPDFTVSTVADNDGTDFLELFRDEVVIDTFGVIGTDGANTAWDFRDGFASRKDNSKPSATFTKAQWDFSGKDALDGRLVNNFFGNKAFEDGSFSCNVDLCNTEAPSNTPSISIAPSDAPSTSPSTSVPSSVPSLSLIPSVAPSILSAPTKATKTTKAPSIKVRR
eukprot:Nitzschia sp. Nitz4//scaffold24_size164493//35547//36780//NITZ4_002312-RA/size164493-augustus-gene-0.264-mRNA-1//-1//CDS//3329544066//7930//frame0